MPTPHSMGLRSLSTPVEEKKRSEKIDCFFLKQCAMIHIEVSEVFEPVKATKTFSFVAFFC